MPVGARWFEISFKGYIYLKSVSSYKHATVQASLPCVGLCHFCKIPVCVQNLPFGFAAYRREPGGNQSSRIQPGLSAFT